VAWGAAACTGARLTPLPANVEAFSLLGDTLWSRPVDPRQGPRAVSLLQQARTEATFDPMNLVSRMRVARRTAAIGRFREAVELYGQAYMIAPSDPRPSLRRGELYLALREFDMAIRDLRFAAELARATEMVELEALPDESSALLPIRWSAAYHLGLAHYFKGEWRRAREAFTEAAEQAVTVDQVTAVALWLYYSALRLGDLDEAVAILGLIPHDFEVVTRHPEFLLLRVFRGELPADSLVGRLMGPQAHDTPAFAYGLGLALELRGDRENAVMAWERGLRSADWADPYYLACEAELARRLR
jgi:tetratricopeptide (TPR) repeat protein